MHMVERTIVAGDPVRDLDVVCVRLVMWLERLGRKIDPPRDVVDEAGDAPTREASTGDAVAEAADATEGHDVETAQAKERRAVLAAFDDDLPLEHREEISVPGRLPPDATREPREVDLGRAELDRDLVVERPQTQLAVPLQCELATVEDHVIVVAEDTHRPFGGRMQRRRALDDPFHDLSVASGVVAE